MFVADSSDVPVVPNTKVRMEAKNSVQLLSPYALLRESFIFQLLMTVDALLSSLRKHESPSLQSLKQVKLGAAKLGALLKVYFIFSCLDLSRITFTE